MDPCKRTSRSLTVLAATAFVIGGVASAVAGPRADVEAESSADAVGLIVFYQDLSGRGEIFTVRPDGSEPRRLSRWRGQDVTPALSPDGRRIVWCSDRDGDVDLYVMASDGSEVLAVASR